MTNHKKFVSRPRFPFSFLENMEDDWDLQEFSSPSGLSVSEDEEKVYIEAAMPGIKSDEIELIFDKNVLWIKGEKQEETEDKKRKFYRRAMRSFSYRVSVPGNIDETKEPEAVYKNGILKVSFKKAKGGQSSKKISIKEE